MSSAITKKWSWKSE